MFKFLAGAVLAVAAVPALAQDAPQTFNGPFIGAQAGWQQDRQRLDTGTGTIGTNTSRFAYGGQVGYDFRLGESAVLGAEVALTGTTGKSDLSNFDLRPGRTITATARLGFLPDASGLLYARGGYSNARFRGLDLTGAEFSQTRDGYTIGAGYERYLGTNVSARVEYNYTGLGSDALPSTSFARSVDYKRHAVTGGINFRF